MMSSINDDPTQWPHRPLLLRAATDSNMTIRGVRYSSSTTADYLPQYSETSLPVNDGTEELGKCLVIDFRTDLFEGSALFRIKTKGSTKTQNDEDCKENKFTGSSSAKGCYFDNKKRTFQAVIQGRFLRSISMSQCVTGQVFHRPAAKLPPKPILRGAVLLFKALAPQLTVDFDGRQPKFLSPLLSTAQTVLSEKKENNDVDGMSSTFPYCDESIEHHLEEPYPTDGASLHQYLYKYNNVPLPKPNRSTNALIKARKKAFNRQYAQKHIQAVFDTDRLYTFEFYQHLLNFDKFCLDLGKGGSHTLKGALNGQPLKCVAAIYDAEGDQLTDYLYDFDIFHESLLT